MKELNGEFKLWLASLLLVVSECDARFVKIKHRNAARDKRTKEHIAEEARAFVLTEEFSIMCRVFGFNPEEIRSKTPEEAFRAYRRLVSDELVIEDGIEWD